MVETIKQAAKGSWRTTAFGIATIVGALAAAAKALLDGDLTTNVDPVQLLTALTTGFGLLSARDDKVTSESAGAK